MAPLIPLTASLLLYRADPPLAFFLIDSMLLRTSFYFTIDDLSLIASLKVIESWICRKCQNLIVWVDRMPFGLTDILLFVLPNFFMTVVYRDAALTFFDVFLSEGRQFLSRLSAALIIVLEERMIECESWDALRMVIIEFFSSLSDPAKVGNFLDATFRIRLSRALGPEEETLQALLGSTSTQLPRITEFGKGGVPVRQENARTLPVSVERTRPVMRRFTDPVILGGRLLSGPLLFEIRRAFPTQMDRYGTARLRYQMSVEGTVLSGLISKSVVHGIWILLFETDRRVIGAAFDGSLTIAFGKKGKFIEQGFVVVFVSDDENGVRVFKRNPSSNYSLYSVDAAGITFGGPRPALFLAAEFRNIHSQACETFDSPALVDDGHTGDHILDTELFQLVDGAREED